jgi:hypothetical protein
MSDIPANLKAIFIGGVIIILVGYGLSFFLNPIETTIVERFFPHPGSQAELINAIIWPATITISTGILIAFVLGGFVTARLSAARPVLNALILAVIFTALVWAPVIIRSLSQYMVPTIYSFTSIFAIVLGAKIGKIAKPVKNAV